MSVVRYDCRWHLTYGARQYCKLVWEKNVMADARDLSLGCDSVEVDGDTGEERRVACSDYAPIDYKRKALSEQQRQELDLLEMAEDDAPTSTRG